MHADLLPLVHRCRSSSLSDPYRDQRYQWPNQIWHMYTFGLFPLVERFCVRYVNSQSWFTEELFNRHLLPGILALNSVQELEIDCLEIPSFMPRIRLRFRHLSTRVQTLNLREPRRSHRQIIYFIGLSKHLQDLNLLYNEASPLAEPTGDLTLVPPFVPPLEGRLKIRNFTRVGLVNGMIDLFGGIRFRRMHLFDVAGMRLLLDARAKTLERVVFSLQDFDLSR